MKKNRYLSVYVAAVLLMVVSVGSVIGVDKTICEQPRIVESPLFYSQAKRFTNDESEVMQTSYIGQDTKVAQFRFASLAVNRGLSQVFRLFQNHPGLLAELLPELCKHESVAPLLEEYDVSVLEVQQQISIFENDPVFLQELLAKYADNTKLAQQPFTTGLNTSNPLAILIVLIALLPIFLLLVMVIATVTIFTCFNFRGCFENLWENILTNFINGMKPA